MSTTDTDVVALLLSDTLPPERLGTLLRAGRKRKGWKRKQAAAMVRISAKRLREYEQGSRPIPADICERLADCYGSDLTAHIPVRVAPTLETAIGTGHDRFLHPQQAADDVIAAYVTFVRRLRRAKPGESMPMRAVDLAALSAALDADPAVIEQRIMDELGCSLEEARALHRQVLVRRVVLPVAGLAAGVGLFAGIQVAHASDTPPAAPPEPVEHEVAFTPPTTNVPARPTTTTVAPTPPSTAPTPGVEVADPRPAPVAHATPAAAPAPEPEIGDADFKEPPADMPPPVIDGNDDTPVGIFPGEQPTR